MAPNLLVEFLQIGPEIDDSDLFTFLDDRMEQFQFTSIGVTKRVVVIGEIQSPGADRTLVAFLVDQIDQPPQSMNET